LVCDGGEGGKKGVGKWGVKMVEGGGTEVLTRLRRWINYCEVTWHVGGGREGREERNDKKIQGEFF
jgi:hypothetical protein